ncbi:MAG: phage portal protein [Candidatus Paceibacterota bacterium]
MGFKDRLLSFASRRKNFFGVQFLTNPNVRCDWNSKEYLKAYETSAYVYAIVTKRAEKVGQVEFRLTNRRTDAEIYEHPILNLLDSPNQMQSKTEFFQLFQTFKDLAGSAYILKIYAGEDRTVPKELHLLRPDWVTTVVDKGTGLISGYKYRVEGSGQDHFFTVEEVIASHYPSPLSFFGGHSPLKSASLAVDTERQLSEYHYKILKNGGRVEGIISFKAEYLTEQQIKQIQADYEKRYAEAKNSGRPLIMYGGSEYKNLGLTPTELSYLESKRLTRDDLLMVFSTPKVIVAQTDDVNYSNAKEGLRVFLSQTIKPLLEGLVNKLDTTLVPEDFVLGFVDPTPDDIDLKLRQIESGSTHNYMTVNEKRELAGLDPLPDGDVILAPLSLVPLSDITTPQEPEPADDDDTDEEDVPDGEVTSKASSRPHPLLNKTVRARYARERARKLKMREAEGLRGVRSFFRGQFKRLLDQLEAGIPEAKSKSLLDETFNMQSEVDLATTALFPLLEKWLKASGQDAKLFSGDKQPFLLTQKLRATIKKRADLLAKTMNETTYRRLQKAFADAIDAGEGRKGIIKNVKKLSKDMTTRRANVIARTEVGVASQEGSMEGYRQAGVQTKVWVAVQDEATRDSHSEMDGEERPIDMPFSNGLMHPLDPDGPPEEVIGCRCSI